MMSERSLIKSQQGAALVISLILLLIMTLIGVASMRGTTEQERMAGAFQDYNRAFQAAEAALRDGERLMQEVAAPTFSGTNGWYESGDGLQRPEWESNAADPGETGMGVVSYRRDIDVPFPPQFYIERMPPVVVEGGVGGSLALGDGAMQEEYDLYRVVARGFGNNQATVSVLEGIYRR